jgi:hypothetical protein
MAASLKMTSFGLLHHVVWQQFTSVSEVLAAFIAMAMSDHPDDGGSKHL